MIVSQILNESQLLLKSIAWLCNRFANFILRTLWDRDSLLFLLCERWEWTCARNCSIYDHACMHAQSMSACHSCYALSCETLQAINFFAILVQLWRLSWILTFPLILLLEKLWSYILLSSMNIVQTTANAFFSLMKVNRSCCKFSKTENSSVYKTFLKIFIIITKAPAKRLQHVDATCRGIVGRNMLHAFGHPVATCCDVLRHVGYWKSN